MWRLLINHLFFLIMPIINGGSGRKMQPTADMDILRLNISISPYYYTVPLRSVLAVLDGKNRKGAAFMGK
jgi:hypothetical protein